MPLYRICKSFTVESGHMLSKHQERCRFPHGHTRRIEVVVAAGALDENGMVLDFKALKLALGSLIDQFDHSMAINSADPMAEVLRAAYPEGVVMFENEEPTTEVIAKYLFDGIALVLSEGFQGKAVSGATYQIPGGRVTLERVRVWETPTSWAEYSA